MTSPTTLKLHDFSDESFINGCYIPDDICDDLVKYFDENPDRHYKGRVYGIAQQTRCFAFMTYLNDVSDGGTEFMYQKLISPAKKGLTMIWPSDWTHTHRGQISHLHLSLIHI